LSRTRMKEGACASSPRDQQLHTKGNDMKSRQQEAADDLRPEYEFDYSKASRGKYHKRLVKGGANIIVLEPDVAKAFRDSAAVNDALRSLLDLTRSTQRLTRRSRGRAEEDTARRPT